MDIFHILFYVPTFNLMMFFTNVFGNIGWAIIIIALISKLITYPLTKGQLEQADKNKEFQGAIKAIQKQYKFNKEKQAQELAKIQAKALPGQLKGCLSIIIFIFLFIQIRGTIVDLVNKGYHSFNEVAYTSELRKDEDSIYFDNGSDLAEGKHNFTIELEATNGAKIVRNFDFVITSNIDQEIEKIKAEELNKTDNTRMVEREALAKMLENERKNDISIFNDKLSNSSKVISLKSFLFFSSEDVTKTIIDKKDGKFNFYLRAPSGETFVSDKTKIYFNGNNVTDNVIINEGEELNLEFMGMNLAKVGADFELVSLAAIPFIIISFLSAITQYMVTKVYTGTSVSAAVQDDKKDKDSKKGSDEELSMSDAMLESTKTMNKILPIMTFVLSMGYFGGASFLPTGVTLFWTAQNLFVIIQQLTMHPKENYSKLQSFFNQILVKK